MRDPSNIQEVIENNPNRFDFNFQQYFSKGFEICNRYWLGFVLFHFVFFLISELVGRLPMVLVGDMLIEVIISPVLLVGVYFVAKNISKNEAYNFDQFWGGTNFIVPLVMIALIQYAFYILCLLPIILSMDFSLYLEWYAEWQRYPLEVESFPGFQAWYFLLVIPIIYFSVAWAYAPLFVIFYNMKAWDAMEASRKVITKQWWVFAVFMLVLGIISFLGVLFFIIGALYTIALSACIFYASFEDFMNFYLKEEDEDDLLNHLIDQGF